jgi:hypothetical protein
MYLVLPLFFAVLGRFKGLLPVLTVWLGSALLAVAATQPRLPRMFQSAVFPPMFIAGIVAYKLLEREPAEPRHRPFPAWAWRSLFWASSF